MKAYLIDPVAHEVTEVDYNGHFTNIYDHIQADVFASARFSETDLVYVDDNGLIREPPVRDFFLIAGYPSLLAGRGLVLGSDESGESVRPTHTLEWVKRNVGFVNAVADGVVAILPKDAAAAREFSAVLRSYRSAS